MGVHDVCEPTEDSMRRAMQQQDYYDEHMRGRLDPELARAGGKRSLTGPGRRTSMWTGEALEDPNGKMFKVEWVRIDKLL